MLPAETGGTTVDGVAGEEGAGGAGGAGTPKVLLARM